MQLAKQQRTSRAGNKNRLDYVTFPPSSFQPAISLALCEKKERSRVVQRANEAAFLRRDVTPRRFLTRPLLGSERGMFETFGEEEELRGVRRKRAISAINKCERAIPVIVSIKK